MAGTTGVVGGGITGASVAYHLANRSDRRVVVFEREQVATRTTAKSAGYVGFRGGHTRTHRELMRRGIRLYKEFLSEPETDVRHRTLGGLGLATTADGRDRLQSRYRTARRAGDERDGQFVEYFEGDALAESMLLPDVRLDAVEAALFWPNYGYVSPAPLAREFATRARREGAEFRTDTAVTDIVRAGSESRAGSGAGSGSGTGAVQGVRTEDGSVDIDHLVLAAGPWNERLAASVGLDLPVRYSVAPALVVDDPSRNTYPSLTHRESGVYLRQHHDRRVFLGHYQGAYDEATPGSGTIPDAVPPETHSLILETAGRLVPGLDDPEIRDEWVGLRTLTPDRNPVIGWTDVPGLSVASYNATGIQHAPAVGDILSRQILDGDPTSHYEDVSVTRFDGYTDVRTP
jgi:sarcosine oxidase subunit beta